jgi:hypothetical protein
LRSLDAFLPENKVFEELGRIAKLFGLDAKLVSPLWIEFRQQPASFTFFSSGGLVAQRQILRSACLRVRATDHPIGDASHLFRAMSRVSAASCETVRTALHCGLSPRLAGSSTRFRKTSNSRAGPNSSVSHFSSDFIALVSDTSKILENSEIAARSRRKPTRI